MYKLNRYKSKFFLRVCRFLHLKIFKILYFGCFLLDVLVFWDKKVYSCVYIDLFLQNMQLLSSQGFLVCKIVKVVKMTFKNIRNVFFNIWIKTIKLNTLPKPVFYSVLNVLVYWVSRKIQIQCNLQVKYTLCFSLKINFL